MINYRRVINDVLALKTISATIYALNLIRRSLTCKLEIECSKEQNYNETLK